jgi:hypothetical protein
MIDQADCMKKTRDDDGNKQIGPRCRGPPDQSRRDDHGDVANRVIAREQPNSPDVRVASPVGKENGRRCNVHNQGGDTEDAIRSASGSLSTIVRYAEFYVGV